MKNVIKILISLYIVPLFSQQEIQYTQNQFNSSISINPAYAGSNENASVSARFRKQWLSLPGSPTTYSLMAESRIYKDKLGAGLSINYDMIGIEKVFNIDGNLCYHLEIDDEKKLSFGSKFGAYFINSDYSNITNVTPGDPLYTGISSYTIPFVGFGGLFYTPDYYIGMTAPRLVSIESSSNRQKINAPHYYLYGGFKYDLDEQLQIRPAIMGKYQSQAPFVVEIASDIWYKNTVSIGMAYRTNDAINFMLKGKIQQIYFGYSYDLNTSKLNNYNGGSHEIFIGFEMKNANPSRNNSIRFF